MSDDGFLSFHTFISTTLIKVVYVIGMVLLTAGGLLSVVVAFMWSYSEGELGRGMMSASSAYEALAGIFAVVFGNLIWRIICESWILLFSMHELLGNIARASKSSDGLVEQSALIAELLRAAEANSEQRHQEMLNALRATATRPTRP